jgi:tetratricopeptide (TPR) repeat protein
MILGITLNHITLIAQSPGYLNDLIKKLDTDDDTTKVLTMNKIVAFYGNQGVFDSADLYSNRMMDLSMKIGYEKGKCIAFNSFGIPQMVNGQYQKALEYFHKSLAVAEKNNLEHEVMIANRNIATIYMYQEDYALAVPLLKKVLDQVTSVNDSVRIFPLLTEIGLCYDKLGVRDSAGLYYEKGIFICKILGNRKMPADMAGVYYQAKTKTTGKTGIYFANNGREREALDLLLPLWKEIEGSPDTYSKIDQLSGICQCYDQLGKTDSVLFYANTMINLKDIENYPDGLKDAYLYRSAALYKTGKFKEAYDDQVQFVRLKDSVFSTEKYKAINELRTKYETAKNEEKIASLNKQKKNQQIMVLTAIAGLMIVSGLLAFAIRSKKLQKKLFRKEQESQRADLERKMFELEQTALRAQMNPHFIFNCLNSVQRFVINNDVSGVNNYLSTFANLIRQTLENSGKPYITLKDELNYLETYIKVEQMRGGGSFDYEINVGNDIAAGEIYIPNMMIQPFVENSIKHGLGGKTGKKGKLRLTVSLDNKLIFVVEDNGDGIGMSEKITVKEEQDHEPMGSLVTQKRIDLYNRLHEEKIHLQVTGMSAAGHEEPGTKVTVEFPVSIN